MADLGKEQVRAANPIEEVVEKDVVLRRRGKSLVGLCPFHTDTRPSFSVNTEGQYFRCFGCDVRGDVFSYVMRRDGIPFAEALKKLADRAGLRRFRLPIEQPRRDINHRPQVAPSPSEIRQIVQRIEELQSEIELVVGQSLRKRWGEAKAQLEAGEINLTEFYLREQFIDYDGELLDEAIQERLNTQREMMRR